MTADAASPVSNKTKWIELTCLSGAYGLAFILINYLHFQLVPVSVILYACLWDALIAGLLVFVPYGVWRLKTGPLLPTEFGLVSFASFLLVMLYAVMGPTVIDRSLSIYIVEKIDYRGGQVSERAMPEIILTEFMNEYQVADVRMTEQVTSRTVDIQDGCIRLTKRGKRLAGFTRFFRENFLPKRRTIAGVESDALTRPYIDAPVLVPYECPQPQ